LARKDYDVIIIGGGHAGTESAWIASQFNLQVAVITMPNVGIATAPCNPAIGGVGKGQVVRELDALGGLMPILADKAGIHYTLLNSSKGYAVRSTRTQIDKDLYPKYARELLDEKSNIEIIEDKVTGVVRDSDGSFIVSTKDDYFHSKKVVVTTGTFLNGKLHQGSDVNAGGRMNSMSSTGLSTLIRNIKTLGKRFKTGTPARLKKSSLDYSKFTEQKSDHKAFNFHWKNYGHDRNLDQVSTYITNTNEDTMNIIRDNKDSSPMFNGQITGVGPRYCPSIEDKAFRYPDRNSHHVFLEPETMEGDSVYPNGISSSLPKEIQDSFIKSIDGLEKVEFHSYGYAVEYDVVDTMYLSNTLEYTEYEGLYFAGQVNGTSGYEEASAQGYIAGVNAALACLGKEKLILNRHESYIGVLVQDLITNKRDEPYRLFTARAENRLWMREDNTYYRMAQYRLSLELNEDIDIFLKSYRKDYDTLIGKALDLTLSSNKETLEMMKVKGYNSFKNTMTLQKLITSSQKDPYSTLLDFIDVKEYNPILVNNVAIDCLYQEYIKRHEKENEKIKEMEKISINWKSLCEESNISFECRQRIKEIRPQTFGELKRIEGIRPATLAFVLHVVK